MQDGKDYISYRAMHPNMPRGRALVSADKVDKDKAKARAKAKAKAKILGAI